ncbi:MAG: hypothetical protein ACOCTG_00450 [Bacteroidota bacterium]
MFAPREPETPFQGGGTFFQADTPDIVVDNVRMAIAEMNARNYRRSLSPEIRFRPASAADAGAPTFVGWSIAEEERYFNTMAASATDGAEHQLRLNDLTVSPVSQDRYTIEGSYVLTVFHSRPEVPREVQGWLLWTLTRDETGLWRIAEWDDRQYDGNTPTWSTLKAAFSP